MHCYHKGAHAQRCSSGFSLQDLQHQCHLQVASIRSRRSITKRKLAHSERCLFSATDVFSFMLSGPLNNMATRLRWCDCDWIKTYFSFNNTHPLFSTRTLMSVLFPSLSCDMWPLSGRTEGRANDLVVEANSCFPWLNSKSSSTRNQGGKQQGPSRDGATVSKCAI